MFRRKVNLKPLIDSSTGIFCHLLEIDDTKIVINCGISNDFDYKIYDPIKKIIEDADGILLTSYDISHMGAVGLFSNSSIYCTIPTAILGKIMLDELYNHLGKRVLTSFVPKQVKYFQPFKINDIDLVTYNAGNLIGNSAFKITKDDESIVICYNFNHRKENFLDGLDFQSLIGINTLLTNSVYSRIPSYTIKARETFLNECIFNCQGSVIISVSFGRIFELLSCLYKHKITLVSKNIKMLVERVKSMVEWAGSRANEILPALDAELVKVSDLLDQKIIVCVDEDPYHGYLGSIVDKFNSRDHTLILISDKYESLDFNKLKVYQFSYRKQEMLPVLEKIEEDLKDDSEEEEHHWSKENSTLFVDGQVSRKDYFPCKKRKKQNNDYGEKVTFQFVKKVDEVELKQTKQVEVEEIEDRFLVKTGIDSNIKIRHLDMPGVSDFFSAKTMLESLSLKKIILINDFEKESPFLASNIMMNQPNTNVYLCNRSLSFDTDADVEKVIISENALGRKFKKLKDKSIMQFKAIRSNNMIDFVEKIEPMIIGCLDQTSLKRSLVENGFQVENVAQKLIINDELQVTFDKNEIEIETGDNELLIAVREVLYKFITIV